MFDFVKNNFVHVAPILVCTGFAVAIMFERGITLYFRYSMSGQSQFFEKVRQLVLSGRIAEAVAFCDRYPSQPVARVVKEGLMRTQLPEEVIQHGLEITVSELQQLVQKRTPFLATIANVATLLGLFGTILGLIHSFEAIGSASAQQRSALLAAGISTAMNATMMGLAVAIPCMVIFSVFAAKTNRINAEIEQAATRMLDIIKQYFYSSSSELEGRDNKVDMRRRVA